MTLSWDEFESVLATVLGSLEDGSRMTIFSLAEEDHYVQCAIDDGRPLTLEAVSDAFLDDAVKVGADGAAALTALGWQSPRDVPGNWWVDIEWPATSAQLSAGAHLLVATLRDVFAVPDPQSMYYRAWRDPGAVQLEFDALGIEGQGAADV